MADREKVIDRIHDAIDVGVCVDLFMDILALLKEQEPVRCKDCAYAFFKEGLVKHGHIFCTKPFTERWQAVKPNDWYCADGLVKNNTNSSEIPNN